MTQAEKTGARIARLRNERVLTQQQLAQQLGVTNKAVSKWETGAGLPDVSVMAPLARELGVTVDELLAGERQPRQSQEARGVMTALRTGGVGNVAVSHRRIRVSGPGYGFFHGHGQGDPGLVYRRRRCELAALREPAPGGCAESFVRFLRSAGRRGRDEPDHIQ